MKRVVLIGIWLIFGVDLLTGIYIIILAMVGHLGRLESVMGCVMTLVAAVVLWIATRTYRRQREKADQDAEDDPYERLDGGHGDLLGHEWHTKGEQWACQAEISQECSFQARQRNGKATGCNPTLSLSGGLLRSPPHLDLAPHHRSVQDQLVALVLPPPRVVLQGTEPLRHPHVAIRAVQKHIEGPPTGTDASGSCVARTSKIEAKHANPH